MRSRYPGNGGSVHGTTAKEIVLWSELRVPSPQAPPKLFTAPATKTQLHPEIVNVAASSTLPQPVAVVMQALAKLEFEVGNPFG
jgi:hypothetical protein